MPRSSASGLTPYAGSAVAPMPSQTWEGEAWPGAAKPAPRGHGLVRRWTGRLVKLGIVAALIGGALYAAYLYLPNVSITLTPQTQLVGPVSFQVIADPSVGVPDPDAGVVPAEQIDIPLSVTDDFPATGADVTEERATGRVRFTSENTLFEVPVAEGTRVSTASGVQFETTQGVSIPKASFRSGPASVTTAVRAVRPGPAGNVAPGTITRLPDGLEAQLVTATNPERTAGGSRTEVRVVTQEDYEAAEASLTEQLESQLDAALDDPASTPRGLVAFPETVSQDDVHVEPAAGDVVGMPAEMFTLTAESRGTILAVDEALVSQMAAERLEASIPEAERIFPESVTIDVGEPSVVDGRIVYDASATAEQYTPLEQSALVAAVRGKSIDEARVILGGYGGVEITPWPEFIGTVPDDPRRINLTILDPQRR